ncbi:MAG TPA: response regulator transcription factor [Thermoleophilaceae bacterium]
MEREGAGFRVLVVDDHDLALRRLKTLFDARPWVERCVTAHSMDEALDRAGAHQPHVALVGVLLGAESGVALCPRLRERSPGTHVIFMLDDGLLSPYAAQRLGASGIVPRNWSAAEIVGAAQMVGLGMTVFPRERKPRALLSPREQDVLSLLATGASNREIADRLSISPYTAKDHVARVYRKLNVRNRAAAATRAQRLGLLG